MAESLGERIALRPAQAAAVSGVSRSVIYEALASGALRSFKVGAARLIFADELRGWLEGHAAGEQTGA